MPPMRERMPKVEMFDELVSPVAPTAALRRTQARYVVGGVDDSAERTADTVADRGMAVLRGDRPFELPRSAAGGESRIRRSASHAAIGGAGGAVDESFATDLDNAMAGGRSIDAGTQHRIHRAIGHDVGDVRIHTDSTADKMAQRIQASAFTVDRNIFFGAGQYRPDTDSGMHTLLHESGHLLEHGGQVRRRAIRRKVSKTAFDLDMEFPQKSGPMAGLRKAVTPTGDISKLRQALLTYHAGAGKPPTDKKQAEATKSLIKYADDWLRKHSKATSPEQRRRIDVVDTIRAEASMEYAKSQAAAIYMGDAQAKIQPAAKQAKSGPGAHPLTNLLHEDGFKSGGTAYDERASLTAYLPEKGQSMRQALVDTGELAAISDEAKAEMTKALEALTPAQFAAIRAYSGEDYKYMNPNVGGWGVGNFKDEPYDPKAKKNKRDTPDVKAAKAAAEQKRLAAKETYEEAGLHAGFVAEAMNVLPIWRGTTFKGATFITDYMGLTTKNMYEAKDYWSTSESIAQAKGFLSLSAEMAATKPTNAVLCTVKVTNGRDIARLSANPHELEILLPPNSRMVIGKRRCLKRGVDDAEIVQRFGESFHRVYPTVTDFWLVDITQQFSSDKDTHGKFQSAATPWTAGAKSGAGAPMAKGGGSRFNR